MSLLLLGAFEFHSLLIHKIYNSFPYNIVTLFGCDNFLSCRNIKIKQTNCKNIVPCLSFLKVILIMKNNIFLKIKQRMNWPWPLVHRALYNKMGCTALSITQWGAQCSLSHSEVIYYIALQFPGFLLSAQFWVHSELESEHPPCLELSTPQIPKNIP